MTKKKNYVNFPNVFGISEHLNDKYFECFKAHDNMYGIYRNKLYPEVKGRLEADDRMYDCLIKKDCPKLLAGCIYYAVRWFGAGCWKK